MGESKMSCVCVYPCVCENERVCVDETEREMRRGRMKFTFIKREKTNGTKVKKSMS